MPNPIFTVNPVSRPEAYNARVVSAALKYAGVETDFVRTEV